MSNNLRTISLSLLLFACSSNVETVEQAILSGAIFTTLPDGTRVNANIYADKEDVYLDGGPGPNAPPGAAGLPAGDYYFQVTDPSGKVLLSTDGVECRRFTVDASGVISAYVTDGCAAPHDTGVDADQSAVTVALFPYLDTPNPGGEYKVWVTAVADYDLVDNPRNFGFAPPDSKTDNYKVIAGTVTPPFCGDGIVQEGETCDDGNTTSGDGCSATCQLEPFCGDGIVQEGETCDDGNTTGGDGCSATCQTEVS